MIVRRLTPRDAEVLRAIRLRSLRDAPSAYGSSYEREVSFTEDVWRSRLRSVGNASLLVERADGQAVGLVIGLRDDDASSAASLVSMWVAPEARGSGAADRLVAELIEWARREGVSTLRLRVTEGNARAEKLYQRHGFERTGTTFLRERDGLTEVEMGLRVGGST